MHGNVGTVLESPFVSILGKTVSCSDTVCDSVCCVGNDFPKDDVLYVEVRGVSLRSRAERSLCFGLSVGFGCPLKGVVFVSSLS